MMQMHYFARVNSNWLEGEAYRHSRSWSHTAPPLALPSVYTVFRELWPWRPYHVLLAPLWLCGSTPSRHASPLSKTH